MYKRILAALLAILMLCSLTACKKDTPKNQGVGWITDGFALEGTEAQKAGTQLGHPDVALDPQTVYSSITYIPQMFYGNYHILGGNEASEKFGAESDYFTWTRQGKEEAFSTLPFGFVAGKNTFYHTLQYVEGYEWMRVYYMQKHTDTYFTMNTVICAYSVEGNKLILKPLDTFNVDQENSRITYAFADVTWEYDFAFRGRNLTLSNGTDSITLHTGLDAYHMVDYLGADAYLTEGSKSFENINRFSILYRPEDNYNSLRIELTDGQRSNSSVGVLQENGLFTFTHVLEDSTKTYQLVYFYCDRDGIILTDGQEIYRYNSRYGDQFRNDISKYLTVDQTAKLEDLTDSQLEAIAEKTENLLEDLAQAYQDAGLNVSVNTETGEIALDSTILFGVNESDISADGKAFLQKFIQVYTSVVFGDEYENFVSTVMVEGHTDTDGSYELNQTLSQARADSVKTYCLSDECGNNSALQEMLQAVGYSYDKPIYKENGEVDMAASRRVSFRFIVNLEQ